MGPILPTAWERAFGVQSGPESGTQAVSLNGFTEGFPAASPAVGFPTANLAVGFSTASLAVGFPTASLAVGSPTARMPKELLRVL